MIAILEYLKARYLDEKAQGMVEYALLVAFVVGIGAYLVYGDNSLGQNIRGVFDSASDLTADAKTQNG